MTRLAHLLATRTFAFAGFFAAALLVANLLVDPGFVQGDALATTLAALAPFAVIAMATAPSVISGGIDLSIGPLLGLANVMMVGVLLPAGLGDPWISIPIVLALGAGVGALNGALVAYWRFPAVISTLCALFVLNGVNGKIVPLAEAAPDNWTNDLTTSVGPIPVALLVIAVPVIVWWLLGRTPYLKALYSVGGDDTTAFTAGVDVSLTRVIAYAVGGLFAAIAGLALTGVIRSADPTLGLQYTLIAFAAVALGGTPFGGGRGGIIGGLLGATGIFLIQNLLSELDIAVSWLQVIYGVVLIGAVVLGARLTAVRRIGVV